MRRRSRLHFLLEGIEGIVITTAVLISWSFSKRWLRHWGSHLQERERVWPGDQYVSSNHETYTRAIDIDAPADSVWPWIVQFGLGRAGFYSYELLERIAGIPVVNVESIEPSMQSLTIGDEILLHPKAPGIPVADLEPGRRICFGVRDDADTTVSRSDPARSWSIYVEPVSDTSCRLLLRGCIESPREPTWLKRIGGALEAPIDFVMEQRMIRTIKRLAEELTVIS